MNCFTCWMVAAGCLLVASCAERRNPSARAQTPPAPKPAQTQEPARSTPPAKPEAPAEPTPAAKPSAPVQIRTGEGTVSLPEMPVAPKRNEAETKLDQALLEWVQAEKKGGSAAAAAYAREKSLPLAGAKVRVKITGNFRPEESAKAMPELQKKVASLGGEVTTSFENVLFAALPVEAVMPLAELNSVWTMATVLPVARPLQR